MNKQGYPVLPSWETINCESAAYKKSLIGKFMSEMYHKWKAFSWGELIAHPNFRDCEGGNKGRIPWVRLKEAQSDFILPKYLPHGITLTQYHHIRLDNANTLLQHWTQRQAAGEVPLQFKNNFKADQCSTPTSEDGDSSTPVVLRDQSEGGAQNTWEDDSNVSCAPDSWLHRHSPPFMVNEAPPSPY